MTLEQKVKFQETKVDDTKEIKAVPKKHAFELIKPNGVIALRLGKIS